MNQVEPDEHALEEVAGPATTLEEFVALPEIEESPAWEFLDGRMVRKVSPKWKHNSLTWVFLDRINGFAEPRGLGEALPEQRCTFGGRSIVPDVVFLLEEHIELDGLGDPVEVVPRAPDLMIEIVSPGQWLKRLEGHLRHAIAHGRPLGWLVDPHRETIAVHRPGVAPVILGVDGVLRGEPVLPGFELPVAEVFDWLKRRRRGRIEPGGRP